MARQLRRRSRNRGQDCGDERRALQRSWRDAAGLYVSLCRFEHQWHAAGLEATATERRGCAAHAQRGSLLRCPGTAAPGLHAGRGRGGVEGLPAGYRQVVRRVARPRKRQLHQPARLCRFAGQWRCAQGAVCTDGRLGSVVAHCLPQCHQPDVGAGPGAQAGTGGAQRAGSKPLADCGTFADGRNPAERMRFAARVGVGGWNPEALSTWAGNPIQNP